MKFGREARLDAIGHVFEVRDELLADVKDLLELLRVLAVEVDFLEGEKDALFNCCHQSVLAEFEWRIFILLAQ